MEVFVPRQTITGLYIQLHEDGFSDNDLKSIQRVYRLAALMFAGQYRRNEKPAACHMVGTASAMAHFDRRHDLVAAGMLHAALDFGLFPDGKFGGDTPSHRTWLATQAGSAVASIVERYQNFKFSPADVEMLSRNYEADGDRDIVKLRLCNDIDDYTDAGLAFAMHDSGRLVSHATNCGILADRIGEPEIGRTIEALGRYSEEILKWAAPLRQGEPAGFKTVTNFRTYLRLRRAHRNGEQVRMLP